MNKKTAFLFLLLLLLPGCGKPAAELPAPVDLYAALEAGVTLPEMLELTAEELSAMIGIEPEEYSAAVCYINLDALQPDEITIVRATDKERADAIAKKLETWMEYKRKSAANYLPENLPMLKQGVIRQDGLTVSLLVTDALEEVLKVYDKYK